jgi:hypothetical protein
MRKSPADISHRVSVWSTGGFGAWLMTRALVLLMCACAVGILLPATAGRGRSRHPRIRVTIYRDSKAVITADPGQDPSASVVGEVAYFVYETQMGLPVTCAFAESHHLIFTKEDPDVPDALFRSAMGQHLTLHANDPDDSRLADLSPYAARITAGDFSIKRFETSGIIIDTLTALAGVAVGVFLIVYIRFNYRKCRQRARSAIGLCPSCGYDMANRINERCPECGEHRSFMPLQTDSPDSH